MTELAPEARELLDRWAPGPATLVSELTTEAVREDDLAVLELQRAPGELHSVEDVEAPGPGGTLPVRVYRPRPERLHPVLFLHGGGFVIGRDGYDAPLRELALASGCLIVAPECRLAPEHPFPAAAEDALAAARWLNAEAPAVGASHTPPAVAGDSSGGNLAATVTHALTREGAPPSFQVLIYPMLDATASSASYDEFAEGYGFSSEKSRWYFDQYLLPGVDRRAPQVSPLFDAGLGDVPATLIATAECDPLRDDGERHAKGLRQVGVTVELRRYRGMIHGFFQMTGALEGSRRLHRELGDWMRAAADQAQRATIGDEAAGA
ncbi:MAG TPA: alpha/beta hydrolase [Solirubrobacteraceae bacterium]|nr:alpha/beta hydrolase [Solirubrobacteraceae bacterium]